jgi:predicted dehydrogenase
MERHNVARREFLKGVAGSAGFMSALPWLGAMKTPVSFSAVESPQGMASSDKLSPKIKFAVIGINHYHIMSQIEATQRGGGEFAALCEAGGQPNLVAQFAKNFPDVKRARSETEILDDPSIQLVLSAGIPEDRAPLGIRVMKHGKDYMSDKPGLITLKQLAEARKVQADTKQIYSIMYSERVENKATVKAGELVKAGAIGKVVQTIGLGPHRVNPKTRPDWFWDKKRYGGILCDIGSHQGDQFLFFTGSTQAEVVASQVGNVNNKQHRDFEDFGDVMLRGNGGMGYIRNDWFTPEGLSTWGDGRLTILGTDGFIEVRKNVDIAGRPGGSHLFLVDQKQTQYIDCANQELPYGPQLVNDVVNRTETAMTQAHCFLATEIMLKAQKLARRL